MAVISVVIPCYRQAHFLAEAIGSALAQAGPEVEVVVVDDGSPDDTATVAGRFPVTLVRQTNRGLSAARNAGLAASRGEYVVFLDADDRLLPGALERGARHLADCPAAAFAAGRFVSIRPDGTFASAARPFGAVPDVYAALLRDNFIAMHATVTYRRSLLGMAPFDASLEAAEDMDLLLRLARAHPVTLFEAPVAEYRQNPEGMTRDPRRMLVGAMRALLKQRAWVAAHPRYRTDYAAGLRFHRELYGAPLLEHAAQAVRRRIAGTAMADLAALARYAPRALAHRVAGMTARRLGLAG